MEFGKPGNLPPAPDIPIVGQPFTLRDWYPTLLLVCNCEAKAPLIVSRTPGQCAGCKKLYSVQGMQVTPQGHIQWQIAIGSPTTTPVEPAVKES